MKIALIGASGQAGSRILKELSDRGHTITAIARNPDKIARLPGATAVKGDVFDKEGLAALIKGHDAVDCQDQARGRRRGDAPRELTWRSRRHLAWPIVAVIAATILVIS
ncbi:NAD(P)H-binding protein [Mesorhizobium sp.]|uniref:NAD(P)-dependent oxidoreductase n=1 Tax=Mesorhizobium sp. TaxID=1871066 RepID=UPI0025FF971B|nr:NAD(P)H-binding protein [Mesorhizobium sp.]